jgi:hypothetical protein
MVRFVYEISSGPTTRAAHGVVRSGHSLGKPARPVQYIFTDPYNRKLATFLERKIRSKEYTYDDFFVLAPSVRSPMTPTRILANRLTEKGIPLYVPTSDEERLDEDVLRGKVVFSTFHQVKGLERKVVLVFQFDQSYLQHYDKSASLELPNALYVAITRASRELVVVHNHNETFLPSVDRHQLRQLVDEKEVEWIDYSKKAVPWNTGLARTPDPADLDNEDDHDVENTARTPSLLRPRMSTAPRAPVAVAAVMVPRARKLGVTDLLRYVPVDVLDRCASLLTIREVFQGDRDQALDIPYKTEQEESRYESVSEITGVAIPSFFEL